MLWSLYNEIVTLKNAFGNVFYNLLSKFKVFFINLKSLYYKVLWLIDIDSIFYH